MRSFQLLIVLIGATLLGCSAGAKDGSSDGLEFHAVASSAPCDTPHAVRDPARPGSCILLGDLVFGPADFTHAIVINEPPNVLGVGLTLDSHSADTFAASHLRHSRRHAVSVRVHVRRFTLGLVLLAARRRAAPTSDSERRARRKDRCHGGIASRRMTLHLDTERQFWRALYYDAGSKVSMVAGGKCCTTTRPFGPTMALASERAFASLASSGRITKGVETPSGWIVARASI